MTKEEILREKADKNSDFLYEEKGNSIFDGQAKTVYEAMEQYAKQQNAELLEALQLMVEKFWLGCTESDKAMFRNEYPESHIIKAEAAIKKASS